MNSGYAPASLLLFLAPAPWAVQAFSVAPRSPVRLSASQLDAAKIGIFFGTSTGSTETVADLLAEALEGEGAEGPFDVESLEDVRGTFSKYDSIIVGTPTWNTGADSERSGTGWDELYYSTLPEIASDLAGTKVAVFGLGDQVSYAENYADATGELYDVFEGLGCQMKFGFTSQDGYEHEASKAIRDGKFCGLLCDMVNQEDLTEERVESWVAQLQEEGFLAENSGGGAAAPVSAEAVAPQAPAAVNGAQDDMSEIIAKLERENAALRQRLEANSNLMDQAIETHSNNGFEPHYNPKTGSTMWTSADGRTCYYTKEATKTSFSP